MSQEPKRLFLLDAYALIFRAYYALIRMPRTTSAGFNTSAIFGFVNTLEELLRKERPSHIAVCFDPPGPTFRHKTLDTYKGEREATPEDIRLSVPIIKEIVRAYNIPLLEVAGFEADDVIGTMAVKAAAEGFTTYMMTPDKDFGQLVTPSVLQYKPSYRGQDFEIRGEEEICTRYGIKRTAQVIDLLALMGDKVDNIPGCPGIGEKTAIKLIAEFDNVENLISSTARLKGALKKKVEDNTEQIKLSKYLATIRTDVPLSETPDSLQLRDADTSKLFAIFDELEFRSLRTRVRNRLESADKASTIKEVRAKQYGKPLTSAVGSLFEDSDFSNHTGTEDYVCQGDPSKFCAVTSGSEFDKLGQSLLEESECAIMLIADGDNDMTSKWIASAIALSDGRAWLLPNTVAESIPFMLDLMARGDMVKITSSAKRDYVLAARHRTDSARALVNYRDVSLAHYLLYPELRHDIYTLASSYLKFQLPTTPYLTTSGNKTSPLEAALKHNPDKFMIWACSITHALYCMARPLDRDIEKEGMKNLLETVELPLATVLADMELTGVQVDVKALNIAADIMQKRLDNLQNEIYDITGVQFTISSPAQVGDILFNKLGLEPKPKKTKTGQYSTNEEVLEKLKEKHPVVNKILLYRQLKKLLNTYLIALPASINPVTKRVHTNYNQTVTATGRISSSNPNLQNIPVRDDEGREIRRAFTVGQNQLFLSADYSQIELRLVADISGDPVMIDAFENDADIHSATASKIYHKKITEVADDERRHAKTANFGILYGISAFGLAARLGIPRSEAKALIDAYFQQFPKVRQFMDDSINLARERGYVETRMGRKRRLPDIISKNPTVRGYAERNAINTPIQGFAADIIKKAMVNIWQEMQDKGLKSKMIMQVHDELNFQVEDEELAVMQELVQRGMEDAYHGRVHLSASCGMASNWLDAH